MKTRFLAWDMRFGRIVVQTGSLEALHRILREGEYPMALMLLGESSTLTFRDTDMAKFATAAHVYAINRQMNSAT